MYFFLVVLKIIFIFLVLFRMMEGEVIDKGCLCGMKELGFKWYLVIYMLMVFKSWLL